jgi:SpoVK/Ycf46/Vps4 family AAA+-type ATPase
VLQLDEIEKGFGGVGGEMDGGSAQRSFGIFLKWLSDRSCPVYVVATANNIRALPVEFTRKGRFDELYGVYLPTHAERQEIFGIHLRLRKREPEQFDLDALARKTEGYTGADIKEVVQLGLKLAFHAGAELIPTITSSPPSPRSGHCRRPIPSRSLKSPSGSTATPSRRGQWPLWSLASFQVCFPAFQPLSSFEQGERP